MGMVNNFPIIMRLYFGVSALSLGSIEFVHDWKRYNKVNPNNVKNILYSFTGFLTGFILGPAFPFFYLADCKALDYKRCPYLK